MRAFLTKNLWLALFICVVILHLLTVVSPLISSTFSAKVQSDESVLVIANRATDFSEEQASNFSSLFGIAPISFVVSTEELVPEQIEPEVKRLNDYKPVLIAVDEVENIHTARLLLVDENQNRLTSIKQGDVLHAYKATQISLNSITFELVEQSDNSALPAQIVLTIFSRNKQNAN